MCERTVAGGHSAGELRGPAASAVQPVHHFQPAGPLCSHSTLGLGSSRSVTVDVPSSLHAYLLPLVPLHSCTSSHAALFQMVWLWVCV